MSAPENNFGLNLHQTFQESLGEAGFKVSTYSFTPPGGNSKTRFVALVMPKKEYREKLDALNAFSFCYWGVERHAAEEDGRSTSDFTQITELPWEIVSKDPRLYTSDSAWDALATSAELAAKIEDNAPPELYFELTDSLDMLGQQGYSSLN